MAGEVILDSSVAIPFLTGETGVVHAVGEAERVYVPVAVVGELFYGARKSNRVAVELQRVEAFVADAIVLQSDLETGRVYAQIKHELRLKGRLLPENDMWIAAVARQHDKPLATRDAHFNIVSGLTLVWW